MKTPAKKLFMHLGALAATLALHGTPQAALVGHWTFEPGTETLDLTGNFAPLQLQGNASFIQGQLDVNGSGTTASGWAVTGPGAYQGPTIIDKTLVSWVTLESFSTVARSGSALTLDRVSSDHFDGIVFAELNPNQWMSGSSFWQRTVSVAAPGLNPISTVGQLAMLAFTYDDLDNVAGGSMVVTGYLNGQLLGSYTTTNGSSWTTGDAEVYFGNRHFTTVSKGALDARISEARIYDTALSQSAIQSLSVTAAATALTVPEPDGLALALAALTGLAFTAWARRQPAPVKRPIDGRA